MTVVDTYLVEKDNEEQFLKYTSLRNNAKVFTEEDEKKKMSGDPKKQHFLRHVHMIRG